MTIPVWVLLGFALWTLVILVMTVGVYRWSRILRGRAPISDFRTPDFHQGSPFHERAMRAHANCVENLPVFGALVVAILASGLDTPTLDALALVFLGARIVHSLIHVSVEQTGKVVSARFAFFAVQVVCMLWMGIHTALAV